MQAFKDDLVIMVYGKARENCICTCIHDFILPLQEKEKTPFVEGVKSDNVLALPLFLTIYLPFHQLSDNSSS